MNDFSAYAAVPGTTEFIPDFFLDQFDDFHQKKAAAPAEAPAAPSSDGVQGVFDKMGKLINDELVAKIQAMYEFDIKGMHLFFHFLIGKLYEKHLIYYFSGACSPLFTNITLRACPCCHYL